MRAYLGLGSNLGDRAGHLRRAIETLGTSVVRVSPVYETDPVGGPGGQGAYLNLVLEIETDLTPRQLLGVCHRLEAAAERVRQERWGPRTLDVDIVAAFGSAPGLVLPHPLAHERAFVIVPWHDVDPKAHLPGHGPVAELLAGLDVSGVRRCPEPLA